jgi:soluble lytic murein transglycosylase-like protein
MVREMSLAAGIDPALAACVVTYESGWDTMRRGMLKERGLFQVLPSTAIWVATKLGWQDFTLDWLDDPVKNIEMGLWILERYPEWYSTLRLCR